MSYRVPNDPRGGTRVNSGRVGHILAVEYDEVRGRARVMTRAGYTNIDVALEVGVSSKTIQRWKRADNAQHTN